MILAIGEITVINVDDVNISTTEPLDPVPDQLWLDTSTVPNVLKRWAWIEDEERWDWVNASPINPEDVGAETPEGAQAKADSAAAAAKQHAEDAAYAAGQAAKTYAEQKAAEAQTAAEAVARAEAELAEIEAKAYADGKVTEEEQARIDDAADNLQAAKEYAEEKADEAAQAAQEAAVEEIRQDLAKYMTFDTATGIQIGAIGSPSQIVIDNRALQFLDLGGGEQGEFTPHPQAVAYIHGKKMYIENIEVLQSLLVGNHTIEKYDDETTVIRWVG